MHTHSVTSPSTQGLDSDFQIQKNISVLGAVALGAVALGVRGCERRVLGRDRLAPR